MTILSHKINELICCLISRGENGELRVGVRRAMRQQGNVPSSVISSHSMHLGVLATAWHAVSTGTMFTVYYKPRCVDLINHICVMSFNLIIVLLNLGLDVEITFGLISLWLISYNRTSPAEFIVPFDQYMESVKNNYTIGMRFKMRFEGEEAPEQRYCFCRKCV